MFSHLKNRIRRVRSWHSQPGQILPVSLQSYRVFKGPQVNSDILRELLKCLCNPLFEQSGNVLSMPISAPWLMAWAIAIKYAYGWRTVLSDFKISLFINDRRDGASKPAWYFKCMLKAFPLKTNQAALQSPVTWTWEWSVKHGWWKTDRSTLAPPDHHYACF